MRRGSAAAPGSFSPREKPSRVIVVERLLVHEALDAMLAVLAPEAALAEAGMEAVRALSGRPVDVDFAEFELVYGAHDLAIVAGKQIGREAVVGIVGVGERLIEVVNGHRRAPPAEGFPVHNLEVVRLDREDGREKPMAAVQPGALRLAFDEWRRLL